MASRACGKMDGNPKKHYEFTGNAERFEAKVGEQICTPNEWDALLKY